MTRLPTRDPRDEFGHTDSGDRRAEEGGYDIACGQSCPELPLDKGGAQIATGALEFLDHALARFREEIDHPIAQRRAFAIALDDRCRTSSEADRGVHRCDAQL